MTEEPRLVLNVQHKYYELCNLKQNVICLCGSHLSTS